MRTILIEDKEIIKQIIQECKTCFLSMSLNDFPYVLPMNFAYENEVVILHSAQSGKMWDILHKNPRVCINWTLGEELAWQDIRVGCSYRVKSRSVIIEGLVEFVDDFDEKLHCLNLLMAQYSDLQFTFSSPSVKNVGILKVIPEKISAREFGVKPMIQGKANGK